MSAGYFMWYNPAKEWYLEKMQTGTIMAAFFFFSVHDFISLVTLILAITFYVGTTVSVIITSHHIRERSIWPPHDTTQVTLTFSLLLPDVLLLDKKMESRNTLRGQPVGVPRWDHLEPPLGPHFSQDTPKLVKAAVGSPAHVPCKVRNLGSKSVGTSVLLPY